MRDTGKLYQNCGYYPNCAKQNNYVQSVIRYINKKPSEGIKNENIIRHLNIEALVCCLNAYTSLIQNELIKRAITKTNNARRITDALIQKGFIANERQNSYIQDLILMIANIDLKSVVISLMQGIDNKNNFKIIEKLLRLLMVTSPKAVPKWIVWGMVEFCEAQRKNVHNMVYEGIVRGVFSPLLEKKQVAIIRSLVGTLIEEACFVHGKRFLIIIARHEKYKALIAKYLTRAREKNDDKAFIMTADEIFYYL